jgi:Protein of unknown function (DUF3187)
LQVFFVLSDGYRDYSKGPLYGKNMYIPYLIYYSFPNIAARSGSKFDFNYHLSLYYTNDFHISKLYVNEDGSYDPAVVRDYEGLVYENGVSFNPIKKLAVGFDLRLISYYGGFLDSVISGYHKAFGFPNGGREYVAENKIRIDIKNNNGVSLFLNKNAVSLGDIDLWTKYTFFEKRWISLAAMGAFKIPSGILSCLSGSGYPDIGTSLLADFRPVWLLTIYLQSGIVIPFDSFIPQAVSKPYPMYNGLIGLELNPLKVFSLNVQMNMKSSPLKSDIKHWQFTGTDYLSLPQLNLLFGVIFAYKGFKWQFYVEEDAITNAGTDITFNLSFSHKLNVNFGL